MGVAVPRYLSISNSQEEQSSFFTASLLLIAASFVVGALITVLFSSSFSIYLFGDAQMISWLIPLYLLTFGFIFHSLIYNYFRGTQAWLIANVMQLINLGIVPAILFYVQKDLYQVLIYLSVFYFIAFLFFLLYVNKQSVLVSFRKIKSTYYKELFTYGMQRVIGDILLGMLFLLPASSITSVSGYEQGGKFAFALMFVNLAGAMLSPISIILLPNVSKQLANNDVSILKKNHHQLALLGIAFGIVSYLCFFFMSDFLISDVFNRNDSQLVDLARGLFLAILGYSIYILLRSYNDAIDVKAVNSLNIFICFSVYFLCVKQPYMLVGNSNYTQKIVLSFDIALTLLGILTYLTSSKRIKKIET